MSQIPVTETAKGGGCGCGCSHDGTPELDARELPPMIRHGAILGSLASVPVGGALVLIAPHDPLPLLGQINDIYGDAITVEYLDRQPDAVKVQFNKVRDAS